MSSPSEASPVNGHASPLADDRTENIANGYQSDSDLSDAQPVSRDTPSPDSPDVLGSTAVKPELSFQEASESSDNDASGDADFDMEASPQSAQSDVENSRPTSSNGSRRALKRKSAQVTEDDFMRDNPELYGLRRSVRSLVTTHCEKANIHPQSRPTQRRQIVSCPDVGLIIDPDTYSGFQVESGDENDDVDDDNDDDDSDVAVNRKVAKRRKIERSQPCMPSLPGRPSTINVHKLT